MKNRGAEKSPVFQRPVRDEFAMVAQAMIELFLPTIDGIGRQAMGAAQLGDWCARLPLLQDGELLLGGNTAASAAFNRWVLVHLHKVIQAFQTVQISTGADHTKFANTMWDAVSKKYASGLNKVYGLVKGGEDAVVDAGGNIIKDNGYIRAEKIICEDGQRLFIKINVK